MKNIFLILFLLFTLFSCDYGQPIKGDFIYYEGVGVIQTDTTIYGVIINKKALKLSRKVNKYKNEETDLIPVEIKGHIVPKPEGEVGWPFRVEIKKIINVYEPNPNDNDLIKVGEK